MAKDKLVWHKMDVSSISNEKTAKAWDRLQKAFAEQKAARLAFETLVSPSILAAQDKDGSKFIVEGQTVAFSYRFGPCFASAPKEKASAAKSGGVKL